jgi:PTH2 family peptidyl-tRNA hydrolase
MQTKQVIVMRKDLNMRKGKIASQAAHASMGAILSEGMVTYAPEGLGGGGYPESYEIPLDREALVDWLRGSFTKICVYVNSEEELDAVYTKAKRVGLIACLITDNGKTEFGGVPTKTCCAIGPAFDNEFTGITDHLPLF